MSNSHAHTLQNKASTGLLFSKTKKYAIKWLKKYYRLRCKWLNKRIPSKNSIQLNVNNTFIMPSGFGWSIIGIAVCLFVLGTNFQNNTILLLCFFLLSVVFLSIFHSYFFFVQHHIHFSTIKADYENRQAKLPIKINSTLEYRGGSLAFRVNKQNLHLQTGLVNRRELTSSLRIDLQTNAQSNERDVNEVTAELPLPKFTRGIHACPQITVTGLYGFGIFKCWTHLTPDIELVVYPSIKKAPIKLRKTNSELALAHSSDSQYVISDNLQGIREHQSTDPMYHVSWKHVAKGQGMLSKDFTENKGVSGWLRIQDFQHVDTEDALRHLCYQVQELDRDHVQFGLDLGVTQILPRQGKAHLDECLFMLAAYQSPALTNNTSDNVKSEKPTMRGKRRLGNSA